MKECKWKQRITIYGFVLCLVGVMVLMVISPKETVSRAERRRLAEKPRLTAKGLLDKSFMDDTEKYLLDHFHFETGCGASRRILPMMCCNRRKIMTSMSLMDTRQSSNIR